MKYIVLLVAILFMLSGCHSETENNRKRNVDPEDHDVEIDTPVDPGPEWEIEIPKINT